MKCVELCTEAAELIGGDRAAQHGPKRENHQNIADLWNAYLARRTDNFFKPLTPTEVTLMMVLLKVARTKCGAYNPDDFKDMVGYAAISGELADEDMG